MSILNPKHPHFRHLLVFLAFIICALAWGSQRTFAVFLEPLLTDFGWARGPASLAATIQMIVTGILAIPAGIFYDKYGPRPVLTVCGILVASSFMLSFFINDLWHLYALQGFLLGAGLGGSTIPLSSTVIRWYTKKAGMVNGIVNAGLGFGTTVMSPLAGLLITEYEWRNAYLLLGAGIFVIYVLFAQYVKLPPRPIGGYAVYQAQKNPVSANVDLSLSQAIKTSTFWMFSLIFFADLYCVNMMMVHIVVHSTDIGFSYTTGQLILSVTAGLSIVGRILAGILGDKLGRKMAIGIGLGLSFFSMIWIIFADQLWMMYLFAIVFGLGGWTVGAITSPYVAELFGFKAHGSLVGAVMLIGTAGGAIGPLVAGYIYDSKGSYDLSFIIAAAVGLAGIILLILLRKPKVKELQNGTETGT